MDFLLTVREKLQGAKTYIVALTGVLTSLTAYIDGQVSLGELITALIAAVGVATVRAGVASEAKKLK